MSIKSVHKSKRKGDPGEFAVRVRESENPPPADKKKRSRRPKHTTLVTQGNTIALEAFPKAMEAAVERALGGTYPSLCTKCGAKLEVNVPGDKELLKLIIERGGGKVSVAGAAPGEASGELTNGQLVKYARMIVDWLDATANVDTRPLEREIAHMPEQPEPEDLPHDQTPT